MYTFNLIDQPWIPVRVDGKLALYSLERTLLEARTIERIEDASPLVQVALYRLLLAVLYRALEGPETLEELADWFDVGFPEERIRAYLERWKFRFDLFDESRPFLQVSDLQNATFNGKAIAPKSWIELSPEIKDGGQGAPIFNHDYRRLTPITVERAALYLLTRQTFALGGLSRTFIYSSKRSPSPNAVTIIPQGQNLLQTFCMSLDPNNYALYAYDVPNWEKAEGQTISILQNKSEEDCLGCAQAYSWLSRSIKLIPILLNGKLYVQNVFIASGIAPKFDIERFYDPMVGTRKIKYGARKGESAFIQFDANRGFWRDFSSLFPAGDGTGRAPRVIALASGLAKRCKARVYLGIFGLSNGTQEAKIDFHRFQRYLLPEAISEDRESDVAGTLHQALMDAEELGKVLDGAARALAKALLAHGNRKLDEGDVSRMVSGFPTASSYWSALEGAFTQLLAQLTPDYLAPRVEAFWLERMLTASKRAWEKTREAAGDDAYALRAIYGAEGILARAQQKFGAQLKEKREQL